MGRVIACGDIHGNIKALEQCIERSKFNFKEDKLIQLGDVMDIDTKEYWQSDTVEELYGRKFR